MPPTLIVQAYRWVQDVDEKLLKTRKKRNFSQYFKWFFTKIPTNQLTTIAII